MFGKEDEWLSTVYSCLVKKHKKKMVWKQSLENIERDNPFPTSGSPFMLVLKKIMLINWLATLSTTFSVESITIALSSPPCYP